MSICGLVLLAAVTVPVTGMYESRSADMESDVSEGIAMLIDDLYYSEMNVFTVPMGDILPDTSSYLEFKGRMVILTTGRGTYKSGTNVDILVPNGTVFGYGDILRLSKSDGILTAERLA
jgi:hypothetical protein